VWFSDGVLDVAAKRVNPDDSWVLQDGQPVPNPYVDSAEVEDSAAKEAALEDLCRAGGIADQVRSAGIVTFAIGLAAGTPESAFDVMRSIATGEGGGQQCGDVTTPSPGEYFGVSDLDTLIEAFHRIGQWGGEPTEETLAVCQGELCAEQHRFVLDSSVQSVHVLARTDVREADIYVSPPAGDTVKIAWGDLNTPSAVSIGDAELVTTALTERTVTFDLRAAQGGEPWTGQWGLALVDPSSTTPEGQSRTLMWIRGGLRLAVDVASRGGAAEFRLGDPAQVRLSLEDMEGNPVDPESLLGEMRVELSLLPSAGDPQLIATGLSAAEIASPIDLDLSAVPIGKTWVRADLQVTTAATVGANGQNVPGTKFAAERTEAKIDVQPPPDFPEVEQYIFLGKVEGPLDSTGTLATRGTGCVWFEAESLQVDAGPRGIGQVVLGEDVARSADDCVAVRGDTDEGLPFTLVSEGEGNGALSGTIMALGVPEEARDPAQATPVRFEAEMEKRPSGTIKWLVFVLTLLIGIGLPLGMLYMSRWRAAVIPARALMSRELDVTVQDGIVLRDNLPLELSSNDLRHLVSIPPGGGREVTAESLTLKTRSGWNLLAEPHVLVTTPAGPVITSDGGPADQEEPGRLPLAIHNSWVAWPGSRESSARVVFLLGVDADDATRAALVNSFKDRLNEFVASPSFTPAPYKAAMDSSRDGEQWSTNNAWADLDDSSEWQYDDDHRTSGTSHLVPPPTTSPDPDRSALSSPANKDKADTSRPSATAREDGWDFGSWNDDGNTTD
jgi:hypothetical protein